MDHLDVEELIRTSYKAVRDNPALWIFGVIGAGALGASALYNFTSSLAQIQGLLAQIMRLRQGLLPGSAPPRPISGGGATGLLITTLVTLAVIYAEACLIRSSAQIYNEGGTTAGQGFREGWHSYLPLVGVWLVTAIIGFLVLLAFGLPIGLAIAGAVMAGLTNPLVIGLFAVLVIGLALAAAAALAVIGVLYLLAGRYVVVDRQPIFDSIGSAWKLLRRRTMSVLLAWWLAIGLAALTFLAAVLLLGLLSVPVGLFAGAGLSAGNATARLISLVFALAVLAIAWIFIQALVRTFFATYWTFAFMTFEERPPRGVAKKGGAGMAA